jgi:ribitol 2-dehydrogenase
LSRHEIVRAEEMRMNWDLTGKVMAITGGASGIGLACTQAAIRAGARVVIIDRAEDRLNDVAERLGIQAIPLRVDITDPADVATMMPRILDLTGQLDVFHANAGTYVGGDILGGDPDAWDRMLNLNINAVFRTIHAVLPHMAERRTGDIIVTSSIAGHIPVMWEPVYTASKHAIQAFVHTLRRQVAKHGLRVGEVSPGIAVTPLLDDWPKENLQKMLETGGVLQPREIAEAVMFMLTRPREVTIRDIVILPQNQDI